MNLAKISIQEQLALFDTESREFWNNISATRFHEIERTIKSNHVKLGAILCGLTVKTKLWKKRFPFADRANPSRVADFIMFELEHGIEKIHDVALFDSFQGQCQTKSA